MIFDKNVENIFGKSLSKIRLGLDPDTLIDHTEKSTEGGFQEDLSRLSRRSQRNKKPPAMRVGKKSYTVESPFRIK